MSLISFLIFKNLIWDFLARKTRFFITVHIIFLYNIITSIKNQLNIMINIFKYFKIFFSDLVLFFCIFDQCASNTLIIPVIKIGTMAKDKTVQFFFASDTINCYVLYTKIVYLWYQELRGQWSQHNMVAYGRNNAFLYDHMVA